MTLRVFFTGADLARTRVATAPQAMWELVLSLHQLRNRHVDADLADWQGATRRALRAAPSSTPSTSPAITSARWRHPRSAQIQPGRRSSISAK